MSSKLDDPVRRAAAAHTDLNTFHIIIQILEGGTLYLPASHEAAQKIVRMCKTEAQRSLRAYDAAKKAIVLSATSNGEGG